MNQLDLSVKIGKLKLCNPVILASGTCGYGVEVAEFVDLSKIGAVIPKSVTVEPRLGNSPHRLWETPSGLLNSIGLQNEGLHEFIAEKLPKIEKLNCPIIVNIAGFTLDDFIVMAEALAPLDAVAALEVNISCPNVKKGGMQFGVDPHSAAEVTTAVRRITDKTMIVKLSPNVTDITAIAKAVEGAGADSVSLINTLLGMAVDVEKRKPRLGNVFGGLSGPAIKPVALRMVYSVSKAVRIPIIGLGGIMTGIDAVEFMLCGASAVQVGTGTLLSPTACMDVLNGIKDYCVRHDMNRVADLTGALAV